MSSVFPQCLTPSIVLSVLEDDDSIYLSEAEYQRISTVLLYYIINLEHLCVSNNTSLSSSSGNLEFYLLALTNLEPAENNHFLSHSETQSILQLINQHYHPSNQDTLDMPVRKCFQTDASYPNTFKCTFERFVSAFTVYWLSSPFRRCWCRGKSRCWSNYGTQSSSNHNQLHAAWVLFHTEEPPISRLLYRLHFSISKFYKQPSDTW